MASCTMLCHGSHAMAHGTQHNTPTMHLQHVVPGVCLGPHMTPYICLCVRTRVGMRIGHAQSQVCHVLKLACAPRWCGTRFESHHNIICSTTIIVCSHYVIVLYCGIPPPFATAPHLQGLAKVVLTKGWQLPQVNKGWHVPRGLQMPPPFVQGLAAHAWYGLPQMQHMLVCTANTRHTPTPTTHTRCPRMPARAPVFRPAHPPPHPTCQGAIG